MSNLIGHTIGHYHILEQLGEGGMAVVYKAFDTRLERTVAVKVLLPEREKTGKFLVRFEREAKALARLAHPNIVRINDYGEQNGIPYLVMDYVSGGTLKKKVGSPMPYQEAARLLLPIARALEYAHQQKIIHRDIKPSNILLTASGEPMLSDFGIAKIITEDETLDLTGTGVGIGTPEYMSPEQGLGHHVDQRADIYSLGVVFYELVTGRKPFRADTPMAVMLKHVTEPLPRPTRFVPNLPERVEHTLVKALAKDPGERYQNMGEFALALESILRNVQLPLQDKRTRDEWTGTRPTITEQIRPVKKRTWIPVAIGGGIFAALVICILAGVILLREFWPTVPGPVTQTPSQTISQDVPVTPSATDIQPTIEHPSETPVPPTETAFPSKTAEFPYCPEPLPSRLNIGMDAEVTTSGMAWQLSLRSEPSFNASRLHVIAAGRDMVILDGPVCAEGSYWWYIRSEQGYEGWAPEGDFEDYWIDPLP